MIYMYIYSYSNNIKSYYFIIHIDAVRKCSKAEIAEGEVVNVIKRHLLRIPEYQKSNYKRKELKESKELRDNKFLKL